MKKIVLCSLCLIVLFLTGCKKKTPEGVWKFEKMEVVFEDETVVYRIGDSIGMESISFILEDETGEIEVLYAVGVAEELKVGDQVRVISSAVKQNGEMVIKPTVYCQTIVSFYTPTIPENQLKDDEVYGKIDFTKRESWDNLPWNDVFNYNYSTCPWEKLPTHLFPWNEYPEKDYPWGNRPLYSLPFHLEEPNTINSLKQDHSSSEDGLIVEYYELTGVVKEITREYSSPIYSEDYMQLELYEDGSGKLIAISMDFEGFYEGKREEYVVSWLQYQDDIRITVQGETSKCTIENGTLVLYQPSYISDGMGYEEKVDTYITYKLID